MSSANGEIYIKVKYAPVDGAHFFIANDKYSDGLCVAHHDLKTAFDEATVQLKALLKLNHDLDCDVEPAVTFDEFAEIVNSAMNSAATKKAAHVRPVVSSEVDWKKVKAA